MNRQITDCELGVLFLEEIDESGGYAAWSGEVQSESDLMIELSYLIPPHDDIEPYIKTSKPYIRAILKDELTFRIKAATAIQKQYNLHGHYSGEKELSAQEISEELYSPRVVTSEVEFISSINPLTYVIPEQIFLPEEYRYDLVTKEILDTDFPVSKRDSVKFEEEDIFILPHLVYSSEFTENNVVVILDSKMNFAGAFFE